MLATENTHPVVAYDDIDIVVQQLLDGARAVRRNVYYMPLPSQIVPQRQSYGIVVLYYEYADRFGHGASLAQPAAQRLNEVVYVQR